MNQEHGPKATRFNNLGANTTDEKIYVGADDRGYYIDSRNGRLRSLDGNDGDHEKINGEEVFYPDNAPDENWFCIGSISVNKRIFEVWTEQNDLADPIIRIDGVIVAQSSNLPFLKDFPLQMDKNEGCAEGEVFIADDNTVPLVYSIQDMLDNVGNDKYFAAYNNDLYTINLDKPPDVPVFIGLDNVDGGGGLPVGSYQYAIAYVTKSGDRTNISEKTPPIPVLRQVSEGSRVFPWVKTFGDESDINSNTSYGPRIRFRITNILNFDSIEIIRYDYNTGSGIDFVPNAKVVGRIDIADGQIGTIDFVDPVDSDREITLSFEEETQQTYLIDSAKGIRYFGTRLTLANVKLVDTTDTSTFIEVGGEKIFPVMENLGVSGHNDPWEHCYRSSNMGGEKETVGVHFWDTAGNKTFVKEHDDLKNVQYPNRRDTMTTNSQNYSYGPMPTLPDIDGNINDVYESFSHESAISKGDKDNFKNILKKGSRTNSTVTENSATDPDDYQAAGGALNTWRLPYLPFRPVNKNEIGDTHDYLPNVEVDTDGFFGLGSKEDYDPQCFALTYYGKGQALGGLDNIPDWVKSFSVTRTERAGRVVMQGLGMYKINPGSYDGNSSDKITKKDNGSMWFFSPDVDAGLVSNAEIDNIKNNPNDYRVQFVSPLGFFSETYSFESNSFKDHLVDMMTYARVQRDQGEINPGTDSATGPGGYVYYNKYRGVDSPLFDVNEGWFSGSDGNKFMAIEFLNELKENRGSYFHIGFQENIYGVKNVGGTAKRDFDDDGLKNWTEPFYMINIVKIGAEVPDNDIQNYKATGTHIKLESIVGLGDGTADQDFFLVDERFEDCCSVPGLDVAPATDKYVCIRNVIEGTEKIFYDVTYDGGTLPTILADILADGFWLSPSGKQVEGVYRTENTNVVNFRNHNFRLIFDEPGFYPSEDEYVIVKYDNRIPIRFFGGDTYVGESIFAPVDKNLVLESNTDDPEETTQFVLNVGFPYGRYKMNPRYYRVKDATGINKIQDTDWHSFSHLRQLCVMFNCDNRIASHYAHNQEYPLEYFPLTHYVMRPNVWDDTEDIEGNNIFSEYIDDYGVLEQGRWEFGGFRFRQSYNVDYSNRGYVEFVSRPEFGFEENFEFCNKVIWSLPKGTNQQDSPGLKTFLTGNAIDIEDGQGEIKFLYSATYSDKGSNLYAITEKGVCLLMTQKDILSNASSDFLTSVASDQFIAKEFWIERKIGSDGEFWRGKAEGTTSTEGEAGEVKIEFLIWPNRDSVYTLVNNEVRDVGEKKYINTLEPLLSNHPLDTSSPMWGAYDERRHEYMLDIQSPIRNGQAVEIRRRNFKMYMSKFAWVGRVDYQFDNYVFNDGRLYGLRDMETYLLDEGFQINGQDIQYELIQVMSTEPAKDKEFIRIGVDTGGRSGNQPTRIQFLDQDLTTIIGVMDDATQGPNYLLRYDAWEQFIPRRSDNGDRMQDQLLVYKIIHNLAEPFKVVNTTVQHKVLK